jgi:hypothetical protein
VIRRSAIETVFINAIIIFSFKGILYRYTIGTKF